MSESSGIQEIQHGSSDYRTVMDARDRILRRPLGLVLTAADTAGEESQRHFVLRCGGAIVAGVIALAGEQGTARLRQMWVEDHCKGQGFGRRLLQGVEEALGDEGITRVKLHARLHVRGFYEACDYLAEGEVFEEIGIPHIMMTRAIRSS